MEERSHQMALQVPCYMNLDEAVSLYQLGVCSPHLGYLLHQWCPSRLMGPPVPGHVLVFPEQSALGPP